MGFLHGKEVGRGSKGQKWGSKILKSRPKHNGNSRGETTIRPMKTRRRGSMQGPTESLVARINETQPNTKRGEKEN